MIKGCKICGISDPKTLTYIVDHPHPPQFVGFIVNWKASSRYVELDRLKELLNIDKKKSKYVAVVVKNDESTLEKICLLYTSPSPRDRTRSRMPSSA